MPEGPRAVLDCGMVELTVANAGALQRFLLEAAALDHPVSLAAVQEIDLAGVQLLLAFDTHRRSQGLPAFACPLPPAVARTLRQVGLGRLLAMESH